MDYSNHEHLYYDISAIKEISILSVAESLGIDVQKKGRNFWCKVRAEKNPSVILHEDRNSFYDFGNQTHGDVISFVQYVQGCTPGAAIAYLGKTFGLEPSMTRKDLLDRPISNWEYGQIGLHGDMATKNFVFPIETATPEELSDMAYGYRIPLNELLKQEPETYKALLEQCAAPFVEKLRNHYYLAVWNYFHLAYAMGNDSIQIYSSQKLRERFEKDTADLNRSERILFRARRNAGLESPEPPRHDPVNIVRQLLHGELTISLGNANEILLSALARQSGSSVREAFMPLYSYFDDRLLSFNHTAEYQAGRVRVQYLSSDEKEIMEVLNEVAREPNPTLEQRIEKAALKQQRQQSRQNPQASLSR